MVYYDSVEYDGITFGIWVFEDGTFVNNGDGGYINWTFVGSFDREEGSGTVDFHKDSKLYCQKVCRFTGRLFYNAHSSMSKPKSSMM